MASEAPISPQRPLSGQPVPEGARATGPVRGGEPPPFFSQPIRQVLLVLLALGLFGAGAWLAYPRVAPVFLSNPALNGVIVVVFVIGLLACFWQLAQLIRAVGWVLAFTGSRVEEPRDPGPLLAPLAALLRNRGAGKVISASSARSILESVTTRIDEARDITRYISNLLIFLGLLGTFYGLATTVPAVVDTIRSLAPSEGEGAGEVFSRLMSGLEDQLGGMGTAFASSLLGLAGSLIVGLLDLFVSHGQNRFTRELEDWLSTITRLGFASDGEGGADGAMLEAFAEHVVQQVDRLHGMLHAADERRAASDERSLAALEALGRDLAPPPAAEAGRLEALPSTLAEAVAGAMEAGHERLAALLQAAFDAQGEAQAAATRTLARQQERAMAALGETLAQYQAQYQAAQAPALEALTQGQGRLVALAEAEAAARQQASQAETADPLAGLAEAQQRLAGSLGEASARTEAAQARAEAQLARLADGQDRLTGTLVEALARAEERALAAPSPARLQEGQERLVQALEAAAGRLEAAEARAEAALAEGAGYGDSESRMRLRSIDVQLLRILEEMAAGRQETMDELRAELSALSRALRRQGEVPEIAFPGRRG